MSARAWRVIHTLMRRLTMAKAKGIVTEKQAAALDFNAWKHDADQWTPPTDEEWAQIGENKLPSLRIAWHILYKSKSELIEIINGMDDATYFAMSNGVRDVEKFFKGCHTIAMTAEARSLAASCVSLQRKGRKKSA
jgi:hypothetical protein